MSIMLVLFSGAHHGCSCNLQDVTGRGFSGWFIRCDLAAVGAVALGVRFHVRRSPDAGVPTVRD